MKRILLIILKNRLKGYKRNEKWYIKIADDSNYYTSYGIPNLIKEIEELEKQIKTKRIILRDKYGWPVVKIKDRPITNIIRLMIHGNVKQTLKYRKKSHSITDNKEDATNCAYFNIER